MIKLVLFSGHNPKFDRLQLGEFEVYSTGGANVAWGGASVPVRSWLTRRFLP